MGQRLQRLPLSLRIAVYAAAAVAMLAVAAGVGAVAALVLGPGSGPPSGQPKGAQSQQSHQQNKGEHLSQLDEASYISKVGDIQRKSVEKFLDSHNKFLRYDALTSDDIDKMRADQAALQGFAEQANDLNPPQKYKGQYEVFRLAINELHEAARLAYTLADNPTAATQSGFDEYDRHVNQAATNLKKSNRMLGRNYKTIEGAKRVSPLS